jgi:hypothetical protein
MVNILDAKHGGGLFEWNMRNGPRKDLATFFARNAHIARLDASACDVNEVKQASNPRPVIPDFDACRTPVSTLAVFFNSLMSALVPPISFAMSSYENPIPSTSHSNPRYTNTRASWGLSNAVCASSAARCEASWELSRAAPSALPGSGPPKQDPVNWFYLS